MGTVHAHDPTLSVRCFVGDCPRVYTNYHSYKKHVYKKHREVLDGLPLQSSDDGTSHLVDTENTSQTLYASEDISNATGARQRVPALFVVEACA